MPRNRTAARFQSTGLAIIVSVGLVAGLAACGAQAPTSAPAPQSTELSPAGDIPDNQAYVTFTASSGAFSLQVPEGWARTSTGSSTTFTDKLNSIVAEQSTSATAPAVESVKQAEVPALTATRTKFALSDVKTFTRDGGSGVVISYLEDSPVNSVTGKVVREAVERYLFWKNGHQLAIILTAPKGSDNVDPWTRVTQSFRWLS
jgi:hypothetical protein